MTVSVDLHQYTDCINRLTDSGQPFVSITLVAIRGSAPQVIGAKAIVTSVGIECGTVGGGKIEARAIQHAQQILTTTQPENICELVTWNLQTDVGMTCGGEVQLLFEYHSAAAWNIAVFGAGHISQALVPLLLTLNCKVHCIDSRLEWIKKLPQHRKLNVVCVAAPETVVADLPANTYFISMTQGHATDLPVLAEVLRTQGPPFVGVIGSQQKAKVLRRELRESGFTPEQVERVYCPLGLPIGNNTPAEIAISIAAQLLQVRDAATA